MARYIGFSTKYYGKCNGVNTNTSFTLKDIQLVKQDLINHLFTIRGERVMQPTFGTIIPNILFEPMDEQTIAAIENEIVRVINSDPRVSLLNIQLTPSYDENTLTVQVLLDYIELNMVEGFELNLEFQ